MNRDLPIHENAPLTFVRACSTLDVFRQAWWTQLLAKLSGIQGLLTHARWLADELAMEGHLITGGFRAARSYRGDSLSTAGPFVPELWFRE
jgi:hypothetical protein